MMIEIVITAKIASMIEDKFIEAIFTLLYIFSVQ